MTTRNGSSGLGPAVEDVPVYTNAGSFTPAFFDNARAAAWVLSRSRADAWHFVFAPNPRTSQVGALLKRVRNKKVVQTIASPPRQFEGIARLLFGDVVVAQSRWTADRIATAARAEGLNDLNVEVIPPPLGVVRPRSRDEAEAARAALELPAGVPVFVYPGDLELSRGADSFARLVETLSGDLPDAVFVFACRAKTADAPRAQQRLAARLAPNRVRFAGELNDLLALMASATAVVFPVDDLWGKVDIPISLLEAMALGVPVVAWDHDTLRDLHGARRVPFDDHRALRDACLELARNDSVRRELTAAQRVAVDAHFRADRVAGRYEQIYDSLLG